jgi:hypothetical protein
MYIWHFEDDNPFLQQSRLFEHSNFLATLLVNDPYFTIYNGDLWNFTVYLQTYWRYPPDIIVSL